MSRQLEESTGSRKAKTGRQQAENRMETDRLKMRKYKYVRNYVRGWKYTILCTLIKKKTKISSYIRKFRVEQLQSHI